MTHKVLHPLRSESAGGVGLAHVGCYSFSLVNFSPRVAAQSDDRLAAISRSDDHSDLVELATGLVSCSPVLDPAKAQSGSGPSTSRE